MEIDEPRNLEGVVFLDIKQWSVNEYHPLPDGQGKPTQVHMWIEVDGFPHPLAIRFHTRRGIDELIMALRKHRDNVWP